MTKYIKHINKEYLFFIALCLLMIFLDAFDKEDPHIHWDHVVLVIVYCFGAFIINYFVFPKYYVNGKIKQFFLFLIFAISLTVVFEEFVFEKIFYPDTKGSILYLHSALMEILPTYAILVGFKIIWDSYERQNKIEHLKRLVAESELENFNSQISPHFLFNNLNTLYSYAIENSSKTPELILQLSGILRYMLYDCKEKLVPLENEIENLKNFINLNKIQLEERGNINFTHPEGLSEKFISPLILIVFVENAFKHSASSQTENIAINIKLEMDDNKLNFYCENSFEEKSNNDNLAKGIGLKNVKSRLNLVYPNKHDLQISSDDNKYIVSLMIDLTSD